MAPERCSTYNAASHTVGNGIEALAVSLGVHFDWVRSGWVITAVVHGGVFLCCWLVEFGPVCCVEMKSSQYVQASALLHGSIALACNERLVLGLWCCFVMLRAGVGLPIFVVVSCCVAF